MKIYPNYSFSFKNPNINKKPGNTTFKGNVGDNTAIIQLDNDDLAKIAAILKNYQQLQMIYKASGSYVGGLFKDEIPVLIPLSDKGFIIKDILKTNDIRDVQIIREAENRNSDELMTFVISSKNNNNSRIIISKNGQAHIIMENSTSDIGSAPITKNKTQLFETIQKETENALSKVEQILDKKAAYGFDLNSPAEIQEVARQFIDEKKRISLLNNIVDQRVFAKNFDFLEGQPKSMEQGILPNQDISFAFSNLENRFFDGMQITVKDKGRGTRQGFVITNDGVILATKEHMLDNPNDNFVPRVDWRVRNLPALTAEEINAKPELKSMFEYAHSHVDKVYRKLLSLFFHQNKIYADTYESSSTEKKNQINRIENSRLQKIEAFNIESAKTETEKLRKREEINALPLAEDNAKILRVHILTPNELNIIKQIAEYNDTLSKANYARQEYQRTRFIDSFGLTRRNFQNGLIFNDLLNTSEFKLGIAKYMYDPKNEEVISLGLFNSDFDEVARLKATKDGKFKVLVKPNMTLAELDRIEQIIKDEMDNGLSEKLLTKLDLASYYLQNAAKVDNYMKKSYATITAEQAIQEMRAGREYHNFSSYKIQNLKETLESIKDVYRKHESAAYRWQKIYFPDIEKPTKYLYGRLNKYDINYEFSFISNEYVSGLRILTRDSNDNFDKCYFIDYEGNSYKLRNMPKNNKYQWLSYTPANLSKLDENAVKQEHLDLIFEKLYRTTNVYNDFLQECSSKLEAGRYKFLANDIEEIARKYKYPGREAENSEKLSSKDYAHSNEITRTDKRGRHPHKKSTKDTPKAIGKTSEKAKKGKAQPVSTKSKKVSPTKEQTTKSLISTPITNTVKVSELSPELRERYATLLKPNGEFKTFREINFEEIIRQFNRIFATPYTERSSHYIHERKPDGNIFSNRFSVIAPDGAMITVSMVRAKEYFDYVYYSIRVQKENEVMYININPETGRIFKCDSNNSIIRDDDGGKLTISREKFEEKNPLCKNMPMYFREIFDEREGCDRKVIDFQVFARSDKKLKQQKMRDFRTAMTTNLSLNIEEEENRI